MRRVRVEIDDDVVEFELDGEVEYGEPVRMLDGDDDLIAGRPFWPQGYVVAPLLTPSELAELRGRVALLVATELAAVNPPGARDFALERYHQRVDDAQHLALVKRCSLRWRIDDLPLPRARIEAWASDLCGVEVEAFNPYMKPQEFQLRVVRPCSRDNNPPHRDVWLARLRDGVNLYLPIVGSTARSALPIVPGSHTWLESEIERTRQGARIGGLEFTVQSVTGATRPWRMHRPDPAPGQAMLFSPYAIHGCGANLEADTTRVSLEVRFWRKGGPHRRTVPGTTPTGSPA